MKEREQLIEISMKSQLYNKKTKDIRANQITWSNNFKK